MPSVVIIHAAEDALPARALAEKLRAARLTPVIEQPPGEALRQSVRDAAVTLALWSPRSVSQDALIDEVSFARTTRRLMHVRMQNAPVPEAFTGEPAGDLTGWRGEDDFPAWRDLLGQIADKAGVQLTARAGGPPGFFQPGAAAGAQVSASAPAPQRAAPAPPRQQAPPRPPAAPQPRAAAPPPLRPLEPEPSGGGRGMMFGLIVLAVIAVVGIGGYFAWSNIQGSETASSAWEDVPRNDARALRAFLDADPGSHRDDAQAALAELEEQSFDAAQEEDTIDAFESFLNDFPESDHAIAARGRIAELRSMPPETPVDPNAQIDPATGLPVIQGAAPADPDLLPPDAMQTPPAPDSNADSGPAALTPPPSAPPPDPAAPAAGDPAPLTPTN